MWKSDQKGHFRLTNGSSCIEKKSLWELHSLDCIERPLGKLHSLGSSVHTFSLVPVSYYNFPLCVLIYLFIYLFVCMFVAYGLLQFLLKFVIFGTNGQENVHRVFIAWFQRQ